MKKRILSALMALCLMLTLVPVSALAEDESIYVSVTGNDERGEGTKDDPYATLAKAVTAAVDGATIYVMSDLTMTESARYWEGKDITITSDPGILSGEKTAFTISRAATGFKPTNDEARGGYNGALIEVGNGASLTLTNIILDDGGHAAYSSDDGSGPYFVQVDATRSGNPVGELRPGSTTVNGQEVSNFQIVQDAMIASYDSNSTITLGEGAVLQNYGGMSAVRVSGATLIMEDGSRITDTTVKTRIKGATGSFGPAGAVWVQSGTVIMEEGSEICNMNGRAIYVDGGTATIGGTISGITAANTAMWQGENGTVLHLRNGAEGTLTGTAKAINCTNGNMVFTDRATFLMEEGSLLGNSDAAGINTTTDPNPSQVDPGDYGTSRNIVTINGEITGIQKERNPIQFKYGTLTIGETANIHHSMTVAGNPVSNDIAVTGATSTYGSISRYLTISPDVTIGESSIYMQKYDFYLDRLNDVKQGNASSASETELKKASTGKGWSQEILASLWLQSDEAETLVLSGIEKEEQSLPVYALVMSTDADGQASGTATVYQVEEADGTMQFTLPATGATGCAVALVQPTEDYGTLTIAGRPAAIQEEPDKEDYTVTYTVTYTLSDNLKNLIQSGGQEFQLEVALDSLLSYSEDVALASGNGFTLRGDVEFANGVLTVPLTYTPGDDSGQGTVTLTFTATLPDSEFQSGTALVTAGSLTGTVTGTSTTTNVYVPSNTAVTNLVAYVVPDPTPDPDPDPGTGSGGSQSDPYLRFDSNGGTAFDPIDGHGSAFTINPYDDSEYGAHIPSRSGYRFTGWYRDSRLTMRVDEDETLRITGSVTIFAGWEETSVPGILRVQAEKLHRCLQQLPEEERKLIEALYFKEYTERA